MLLESHSGSQEQSFTCTSITATRLDKANLSVGLCLYIASFGTVLEQEMEVARTVLALEHFPVHQPHYSRAEIC